MSNSSNFSPDLGAAVGDRNIEIRVFRDKDIVACPHARSFSFTTREFELKGSDFIPTTPHIGTVEMPGATEDDLRSAIAKLQSEGLKLRARKDRAYRAASGEHVVPFYIVEPQTDVDNAAITKAEAKRQRRAAKRGFANAPQESKAQQSAIA